MFKKLKEFTEESSLLTVRCTNAWLEKKPIPTLFVTIEEEMEVLTSSEERLKHSKSISPTWLEEQLKKWKNGDASRIDVATPEHPLEVLTGDIALILVIEGKKYLLSVFRDISPIGWLIPGGCPRNKKELLNPRLLASRECAEEILISDDKGRVYNIYPSTEELEENIREWKLVSPEIVSILPTELPPKGGDVRNLVIEHDGRYQIENINVLINSRTASVAVTIYWKVILPIKLKNLRLFDGEKNPEGKLLNRPIRLTDKNEKVKAIFSGGHNILLSTWHLESDRKRMFIP